jgi:hypothetical protein
VIAEKYLLSSAYFPPIHYLALVAQAKNIYIEKRENYLKQTYRNRFYILSANGPLVLSVPVLMGSLHKMQIKDIKIDYSKRWQKIHLRALISSYKSSIFFEYYFDSVEKIILDNCRFLLDLNMASLEAVLNMTNIKTPVSYTEVYEPVTGETYDYRYLISPKKKIEDDFVRHNSYYQVFGDKFGFVSGLSILDLIFNLGPDTAGYLLSLKIKGAVSEV